VATGCGAVTLTAFRRAPAARDPRRVAVTAPACRHPARQPSAAAVQKIGAGMFQE